MTLWYYQPMYRDSTLSTWTDQQLEQFFSGVFMECQRQGYSLESVAQWVLTVGLTYDDLLALSRHQEPNHTLYITEAHVRTLATKLGYSSPLDLIDVFESERGTS
jgi:hypothetical protein